jgi:threonine/homoserine/homoserine lactone efflux protein
VFLNELGATLPSGILLWGFIAAALVVLLIPGPGVLYVVARSVTQGRRAGLASVAGLSFGALVHVVAAAGGLSAILLTSATAFSIVKALGAAYLIYLGLRAIFSRPDAVSLKHPTPLAMNRLVIDGVVISIFNPKIAVFFLAFLPQFVDPSVGPIATQVLFLGVLYVVLAVVTDGAYALVAGSLRRWATGPMLLGRVPRVVTGSLYIGLGINTAVSGRPM